MWDTELLISSPFLFFFSFPSDGEFEGDVFLSFFPLKSHPAVFPSTSRQIVPFTYRYQNYGARTRVGRDRKGKERSGEKEERHERSLKETYGDRK